MRKEIIFLILLCLLIVLPMTVFSCDTPSEEHPVTSGEVLPQASPKDNEVVFKDDFNEGGLDLTQWGMTSLNDFAEMIIDVYDVAPTEETDYRLRLRANTIGTSDKTVKFLGVRSLQKIDFLQEKVISFDLDWNNQANGCYLTAGMYLCPVATDANPRDEPNWIALKYVGVPPGKNVRFQVAKKIDGVLRPLFNEGWPDEQRTGREIANQYVELFIDQSSLKLLENGKELFSTENHGINFTQAYLYLQMSSHSNYPSREVYFDNIVVQSAS